MLDGECKIEFEKYLDSLEFESTLLCDRDGTPWTAREVFEELIPSMKWGVEVDFFDSVGIVVGIFTYTGYNPVIYRGYVSNEKTLGSSKTRHEARSAAITKANELFNLRRESK